MFECHICYDSPVEPVVTKCGHIYCWKCIYKWIKQPNSTLVCPVCKGGVSVETLTPIYAKGNSDDPRKKTEDDIPKRP